MNRSPIQFSPLSFHLLQIQYFVPLTDAEFQERLERHKGEIAIMLKSSEFNEDKTTLIVTNNPLPLLISGQQLATRFQFFSKDLLGTVWRMYFYFIFLQIFFPRGKR